MATRPTPAQPDESDAYEVLLPDGWRDLLPEGIQSRIVGVRFERVADVLFNPANWRIHPRAQQEALERMIRTVGLVQFIVINETTGHLVDGHLRVQIADRLGMERILAVVVALDPDEELAVLYSLDPLSAMAVPDRAKLAEGLEDLRARSPSLLDALKELRPAFSVEPTLVGDLRPHPRNFREHPDDQLAHLAESVREYGFYRNVVVARDGTILAGHALVAAARAAGLESVPAVRLALAPDDPLALKVLAGDNGIGHLAEVDDRALSELLKEIKDSGTTELLGTGYDELMLANLVFVTRPQAEIQSFDEAAHWVGMPEYEAGTEPLKLIVSFRSEADRTEFVRASELRVTKLTGPTLSCWWPNKEREDLASLRFTADA